MSQHTSLPSGWLPGDLYGASNVVLYNLDKEDLDVFVFTIFF